MDANPIVSLVHLHVRDMSVAIISPKRLRTLVPALVLVGLTAPGGPSRAEPPPSPPVVWLTRAVLDSMSAVFARFNEHWAEQADLNTMERMLGTIRPGTREYLGCLQGTVSHDTIRITSLVTAADLKQLPLAVTGSCDSVPRLLGTWHTHPFRPDLQNLPVKERRLSPQDLATFRESDDVVLLVIWDEDSLDAAVREGGRVIHPVPLTVR